MQEQPTIQELQTALFKCMYHNMTLDIAWGMVESTILSYVIAQNAEFQKDDNFTVLGHDSNNDPLFDTATDVFHSINLAGDYDLANPVELSSLCFHIGETLEQAATSYNLIAGTLKLRLRGADSRPFVVRPTIMFARRRDLSEIMPDAG